MKDIHLIRNLYWEQTACIRVHNDKREYTKIERGVRQECIFSPNLFNLYSELQELDDLKGLLVGVSTNNLKYVDDTILNQKKDYKTVEQGSG